MIKAIIDTGPIVAFFDESDSYCNSIRSFLKEFRGRLFANLAVVTEVSYLFSDNKKIQNSLIECIQDGAITMLNQDNEHFPLIYYFMDKYPECREDSALRIFALPFLARKKSLSCQQISRHGRKFILRPGPVAHQGYDRGFLSI
nr:hypothetical protein [Leptospira wolffii]